MRLTKCLIIVACVMLTAAPLFAQSAACALPPIATGSALIGATINQSFCDNEMDTNGNPVTLTGFAQYVGPPGGPFVRTLQTFTRDPIADSLGRHAYTRAMTAPAVAGTYIYTVAAVAGATEGAPSNTFTLAVTAFPPGVPGAPTNMKTVQLIVKPIKWLFRWA
jgi:hypothetical protein